MAIFNKKSELSRSELRESLRRSSGKIPDSGRWFSREERAKLEKEFESKYGSHISKSDALRELREQRKLKERAKTYDEKMAIDRKIRYLKNFFGIKEF